jgi:exportin-T
LAWNPSSDQNLQQQAFNFLNQLRADPQAWQVCATLFTRFPKRSDVVRLVCLDVLNNVVHTRNLDQPSLISLKEVLLNYARQAYGPGASGDVDSTALQNKLTQTFTYLFAALYQEGWQSFIDDFLALTAGPGTGRMDNEQGAIMYLRVLGSVHDEIADMLLSRQGDEMKRNTDLKDMVRNRDMLKIAESWQNLLQEYGNRNNDITEMTLKTLGKWVSWADISLIINQNMLNLIFPFIGRTNAASTEDKVRDAAIEAFREMVAKRMKPAEKTELISILNLREVVATLINSQPLREFKGTPKYDTDLAEAVANLVNTTVTAILEDGNIGRGTQGEAERQLSDFVPFLLRFFTDEYDEVCSTVIPAITDLLSRLRSLVLVAPGYKEMLPDILNAIILKMRYDETAQWGNEDEQTDEAEFQELRKRLQNLQRSVAAADPDLYMEILSNLVATTFHTLGQQGSQMDWRDLDLALHEMYLFGELALPNTGLGTKSQANPVAGDRLAAMMSSLVESGEPRISVHTLGYLC